MADFFLDINNFASGLQVLEDTTAAPIGSARTMTNMQVTDRGGLAPRPGTSIFGTYDTGITGIDGFYNFLKTGVQTEIPVKASNGILKYYHPTLLDWYTIKSGYTPGAEFGFKEHLINTDNEDYLYFGNAKENYSRWQGSTAVTVGTYASGTTLTVDSTLKAQTYETGTFSSSPADSGTSTATSTTTLTDSAKTWVVNQWTNYWVKITSGVQSGNYAQISTNTSTQLTFSPLGGDPGAGCTYQIIGIYTQSAQTYAADSTKTWATSQWRGFYILITSGTYAGSISIINDNTPHVLQFGSVGGDPSPGDTYQIRMPKFPLSGTLMVGNTTVAYTTIPTSTTFTITDPGTGIAAGSAVTVQPTEFPGAPKGNRLENHHTRMIVGGVQSGVSRNAAGALQGSQSTATIYVSKIRDATDFTFSAPRVAGQGDLITAPYGGGNIADVVNFEDSFAVFKKYYIELDKYATDSTADIVATTPLKQGYGSINHAIKGRDDVFFVTADKEITSLSRVQLKDTVPQTTNIGLIIKRLLDTFDFTSVVGHEYKQRILFACKQSSNDSHNNQIIVYNKQNKAFEGIWYLNASAFDIINGQLYAGDSTSPNVYQLFTDDHNDTRSSIVKFGLTGQWRSNWLHLVPRRSRFRTKPSSFQTMSINAMAFEGYITDGTVITYTLAIDFTDTPELQFNFGILPDDEVFMQGAELGAFLGSNPLGLQPLGSISDPDPSGQRHFKFIIYFPDKYCNYLSLGIDFNGTDQSFEHIKFGLGTSEEALLNETSFKDIN